MIWRHPAHPGRRIRLAYCLNLHPAGDLEETLAGLRTITLPLRDRIVEQVGASSAFGVGMYLPHSFARALADERGERDLYRLARFLEQHRFDPFTFNAFPRSGFHTDGLKERVFEPTWADDARVQFTLDVARAAVALVRRTREVSTDDHISISTHTGMFGANVRSPADLAACAENLALVVDDLARLEEEHGLRVVLSLEPEPRASAGDTAELARFFALARNVAIEVLENERNRESARARELVARHLGACLDACHAAVEFEDDPLANLRGIALGKLQYSNALALRDPGANATARAQFFGLSEPRYLHQVTGRRAAEFMRATDLPEIRTACETAGDARGTAWLACDEWRVHFHVPVDLERVGDGLSTTRAYADLLLTRLLGDPAAWSTPELHVEIETYTWDVMPGSARGAGDLVDGLTREYTHVLELLTRAGWRHV